MGIGLTLERDIAVGEEEVAVLEQPEKPFENVKEVKADEEEFAHLRRVDLLMVDHHAVARPFGEKDAEEIDRMEATPYRENAVVNDFH